MNGKLLFIMRKVCCFFIILNTLTLFSQVSTYKFFQNTGTYTALSSPTAIVSNSTAWDDGVANNILIGFTFKMNGVDYTSCSVNYNGFITFGTTSSATTETNPISNTTAYSAAISGLGINLNATADTTVRSISYQTIGTSPNRVFIVQWKDVLRVGDSSNPWNFQIRLHETSNIISVMYGSCTPNSSNLTAQIGLRGATNTDYNNRRLTTNANWLNNTSTGTANDHSVLMQSSDAKPTSGTTFSWSPKYCIPIVSSNTASNYFQKVSFLGALSPDITNNSTYATEEPYGYQDFTGLANKAIQAQGNGINVYVELPSQAFVKAWVDWDNNGLFNDSTEKVYTSGGVNGYGNTAIYTTTFGFKIPANQPIGNYRLRIRSTGSGSPNPNSCDNVTAGRETEDYLFTVVTNCSASVISTTNASRCGGGTAVLSAKGNSSVNEFRWYDAETGGTQLGTSTATVTAGETTTTWTTPSVTTTTTYYVAGYNTANNCESNVRVPVTIRINPVPTVSLVKSDPNFCGENSVVGISAVGDNQKDYLLEEDFENGSLGQFKNENFIDKGATYNPKTIWQYKPSTFIPVESVWFPAISTGINGNGFAFATSDVNQGDIENALLSPVITKANTYINLTLTLRMYYSVYAARVANLDPATITNDFVSIDVKADGGNWVNDVYKIIYDVGIGTRFEQKTFDFSAYKATNTLQFRIRYKAGYNDGVAVDDIQLFGERPLSTSFTWTSNHGSNSISVYSNANATIPYLQGTETSAIYLKPSLDQLETYTGWNITATATLSNGCSTTGVINIPNRTKIWNNLTSLNDWNTEHWKPFDATPPATNPNIPKDLSYCIIVRSPLNIFEGTQTTPVLGYGKNIVVKSGGKLNVKSEAILKIKEDVTNEAAPEDFVIESDGSLWQVNDDAVNTGSITVERKANLKRLDYNYWGSPVKEQNLKAFSSGTKDSRFYVYREKDDYFDGVFSYSSYPGFTQAGAFPLKNKSTYNFEIGKGYAIRAPDNFPTTSTPFTGSFKGVPNNGSYTIPLAKSGITPEEKGHNMISNPYPSNIDWKAIYDNNTNLVYSTIFMWTNTNYNPEMQASNYPSNLTIPVSKQIVNNYAIFNGTGGVPAPFGGSGNNNTIGTGTNNNNCPAGCKPTQYIRPGQGFIIKAKTAGNLKLNNSYRVTGGNVYFFNRVAGGSGGANKIAKSITESQEDRFWLSLKTPLNFITPLLIGYVNGASNQFEEDFDAELLVEAGDSFYSVLDNKKLAIQGRQYPLNDNDMVSLGASFGLQGNYEIFIDSPEGIFSTEKDVLLNDKLTGIITNISQKPYSFEADAGDVNDRFEIYYANKSTLSNPLEVKDVLKIYQTTDNIEINSPDNINHVYLYDMSGKIIYQEARNDKFIKIPSKSLPKGVYLVKIIMNGKAETKKIIKQ